MHSCCHAETALQLSLSPGFIVSLQRGNVSQSGGAIGWLQSEWRCTVSTMRTTWWLEGQRFKRASDQQHAFHTGTWLNDKPRTPQALSYSAAFLSRQQTTQRTAARIAPQHVLHQARPGLPRPVASRADPPYDTRPPAPARQHSDSPHLPALSSTAKWEQPCAAQTRVLVPVWMCVPVRML